MSEATETNAEMLLKIVVVGDTSVGKTNIVGRYVNDVFSEDTKNTIGVDFSLHSLRLEDKEVKIQFWDTAGQEKYKAMSTAYYRNAHGAIVVYDITDIDTFYNCTEWVTEVKALAHVIPRILLLGNKIDLEEERAVNIDVAQKFAKERNIEFKEVSAKDNKEQCINTAIDEYIKSLVKFFETKPEMQKTQEDQLIIRKEAEQTRTEFKSFDENKKCCLMN